MLSETTLPKDEKDNNLYTISYKVNYLFLNNLSNNN